MTQLKFLLTRLILNALKDGQALDKEHFNRYNVYKVS